MLTRWTNPPANIHREDDGSLLVTASENSDAWLRTYYGFEAASENAWVGKWGAETGFEVTFLLDFDQQFDQAGIFVLGGESDWIKAGVEFADGVPQVGAVVTHGYSDWSVAPVPSWRGRPVTVRATRKDNAVIIRAAVAGEPQLPIRVAYMDPEMPLEVGLYCASPSRSGLTVKFLSWGSTAGESGLH